jgi:adenylate cyclase
LGPQWRKTIAYSAAVQRLGGILISHETYSLVKDVVVAEEQNPIHAKGFAKPVRNYRVLDHEDQVRAQSHVIRKEKMV